MTLLLMTLANAPTLADCDKARASGDFADLEGVLSVTYESSRFGTWK